MDRQKLEGKIRLLYRQIADSERRLDKADPYDRSIIEVGIKAMREAAITIQRRLDGRQ
jgi:hypothetical protein